MENFFSTAGFLGDIKDAPKGVAAGNKLDIPFRINELEREYLTTEEVVVKKLLAPAANSAKVSVTERLQKRYIKKKQKLQRILSKGLVSEAD
ncbi:hypothetical protein RUM43_004777 [Polyplax serrata]|uniref:Uncharacterized protein n=1 Tax=Polyplax serrata TaxID=468196 RepID=A0AAN8XQI3_POLSC